MSFFAPHRSPLVGLLVALGAVILLAGCPEQDQDPDAGHDVGPDTDVTAGPISVELGKRADADNTFADLGDDPTLEVVSGFQGGFHLEPALRIGEPGIEDFITVVEYTVTDVTSGEHYSQAPLSYRVRHLAWNHVPGTGYVRTWEQVFLQIMDDDEIAEKTVRIDVRVVVEETRAVGTDSAVFQIVNEINELR